MKKIIIILVILFIGILSNAQALKSYADTANYLISKIENKKAQFLEKPFSMLYDSLKIKPVYAIAEYTKKKEEFGRVLRTYFNYQFDNFSKTHILIIIFDSSLIYNILHPLLFPGIGKPIDMNAVTKLYKPLIVKDIIVKDYQQDEPINPAVMLQKE